MGKILFIAIIPTGPTTYSPGTTQHYIQHQFRVASMICVMNTILDRNIFFTLTTFLPNPYKSIPKAPLTLVNKSRNI